MVIVPSNYIIDGRCSKPQPVYGYCFNNTFKFSIEIILDKFV